MKRIAIFLRRWTTAMMLLSLAGKFCQPQALANPTGGSVAQGSATFSASGSQLTINTSDNVFINWQSFNIGVGENTTFVQPSSSSVVWNHINDSNPSQILGGLDANGYVVLQNASGFYIGGQASISTHGLVLTTAPTPMPDLSSGGTWSFSAPPPTAKIINYGRINITGGGSAFLIANNVENHGTISAPGGKIGLYAGEQVLVSTSPDGRGLSAEVTLPQGSVDNQGNLIADGGSIIAQAQVVNQSGLIQANSVKDVNGTIELVARDNLNLEANSTISAQGDSQDISSGGSVTVKSSNHFSDQAGSTINISGGAQGGNGGQAEISAPNMDSIQSSINGQAIAGFVNGQLTIDPLNIQLVASGGNGTGGEYSSGTVDSSDAPMTGTLTLNVNSFSKMLSTINLAAMNNIEVSTLWNLADPGTMATLNLTAGNKITLDNNAAIVGENNWNLNLTAGVSLPSGSKPASGNDGIYLNGNAYLQTQNGNITLNAANEVIVNSGAIRTLKGGNIAVTTAFGDVNTGSSTSGFNFVANAPYYSPFAINPFTGVVGTGSTLGGISTAGGGNVNISAAGNVISLSTTAVGTGDAGTGAFGSQPGNVTITAGGSVYGHFVVINGAGTINAGQDIGNAAKNVALSLANNSIWTLDAAGNVYLQEARNPNGVFNNKGTVGNGGNHFFDYGPLAGVDLTAGNAVYLVGQNLPRPNDVVPLIMPPSLDITAGAGGVLLENNFTLYPSPDGNLEINDGGNFSSLGGNYELLMSDSGQTHWFISNSGTQPFSSADHASVPAELNNNTLVTIQVSGDMNNVTLQTTKQTRITVDGNMSGCSFFGENLSAGDVTSITVGGQISNPTSFNFVPLDEVIQNLPLTDLPPNTVNNWETILSVAVDPTRVANLQIPASVPPSQYAVYVNQVLLFGNSLQSSFAYNSATQPPQLTYVGSMSQSVENALSQPLTVIRYGPNGFPLVDANGHFVTDQITWVDPQKIQTLYAESQGAPSLGNSGGAYVVGGTGDFDITANSISLGNARGIITLGNGVLLGADYSFLTPYMAAADEHGANINLEVTGSDSTVNGANVSSLEMPGSTIAALGGGNVSVTSDNGSMDLGSQYLVSFEATIMNNDNLGLGIYSSGGGDVTVTACGDINVDSSRIATFNGGKINVLSQTGNVDAGSGGNVSIPVNVFSPQINPKDLVEPFEYVYANGIVAETLVNASKIPDSASLPGDITVNTPQGDIFASQGGILQEALNGNVAAGPTITLTAGTPPSDDSPGYVGNIDLGDSGVIGGTVNVTASGSITGLLISRQNSNVNAAQSFSGTVLSGGTANLSAGGSISGTVIGGGGVNASGAGGVSATLLGQNVSVNGGAAQSTLGTSATATSSSQSAAATTSNESQQQVASNDSGDDEKKKKKHPALERVKRVTVILPKSS